MILKEGKIVTLRVAPGIYFPKEMKAAADAYQIVNNRTGVVEFEEVQLAAAWEAFQHFDKFLAEVFDEIEGKEKPELVIASTTQDLTQLQ